jgi:hypothetical protein
VGYNSVLPETDSNIADNISLLQENNSNVVTTHSGIQETEDMLHNE